MAVAIVKEGLDRNGWTWHSEKQSACRGCGSLRTTRPRLTRLPLTAVPSGWIPVSSPSRGPAVVFGGGTALSGYPPRVAVKVPVSASVQLAVEYVPLIDVVLLIVAVKL